MVVGCLRRAVRPYARSILSFIVALLAVAGCVDGAHVSLSPTAGDDGSGVSPYRVPVAESVVLAVARGDLANALVLLDGTFMAPAFVNSAAADPMQDIAQVQAEVLDALPEGMLTEVHAYKHFPVMYAAVGAEALAALTEHPAVLEVFDNRIFLPTLTQSLGLIQQPAVAQTGRIGAGTAVAVLDTGTDYTQPVFGSCSAPGTPSSCRVAAALDFAPEDNQRDENGHGTNVAGIVASVAPGTKILALDVFTGPGAASNVILNALDWVIANRDRYNVVAVNMSLGAGLYTSSCGGDVFAPGLQALRDAGILPVVASGNNGATNAISSPACVPAALSVGAVYDANVGSPSYPSAGCSDVLTVADKVTCFSNSSAQLSMLAPGASILAAGLQMSGTSQAAPHVAGAAAVLAAAFPGATPNDLSTRLTQSGPPIVDARNGLVRRRLDLAAALALDTGGPAPAEPTPEEPAPAVDTQGPTGSVVLQDGVEVVSDSTVSLTITAEDESGVASMCVANRSRCRAFVPFEESLTWTLSRGSGRRTVYVWLRDELGNASLLSGSIVVDKLPPIDGTVEVVPGDGAVQLTMVGARDTHSSVESYVVVGTVGTRAPPNCTSGDELYSGTDPTATITGLENGVTVALRMCVKDATDHISRGVVVTAQPAPEFDPPTGAVIISDGATYTNTRAVTLAISGNDASEITSMCISVTSRCTAYVPYVESVPFTLGRANGVSTVYVYLRDEWGNRSDPAFTDTIILDSGPPLDGTVEVEAGDGTVQLVMTGASDLHSSVESYVVVGAVGTRAPSTCMSGVELYNGADPSATITGLTNGVILSLRMCVKDENGNLSRGVTVRARPAPEYDPPVGTVLIAGGADHTATRTVTLTISAQDESGIGSMCVSASSRCTSFVPFAATVPFTLRTSSGDASVYVYLRDPWGNQGTAITDSILVDAVAPRITSLAATLSGPGQLDLSWAAYDIGLGLGTYELRYSQGSTAPRDCSAGTALYAGAGTGYVHSGLSAGSHSYRLCAFDQLGNTSSRAYAVVVP